MKISINKKFMYLVLLVVLLFALMLLTSSCSKNKQKYCSFPKAINGMCHSECGSPSECHLAFPGDKGPGCSFGQVCNDACYCEWIDKDLDSFPLKNLGGMGYPVDCDDTDPTVFPSAPEICDNKDNDCDDKIDEDGVCDKNIFFCSKDGFDNGACLPSQWCSANTLNTSASCDYLTTDKDLGNNEAYVFVCDNYFSDGDYGCYKAIKGSFSVLTTCNNNNLKDATEECDGSDLGNLECANFGYQGGNLTCDHCAYSFDYCRGLVCNHNNYRDPGEECDGSDFDGKTCGYFGLGGNNLRCNDACLLDKAGCSITTTTTLCGNNVIDVLEDCEGSNLNGKSCKDFGFSSDGLSCSPDCSYDYTNCLSISCDNDNVAEPGEACDGSDLDGRSCQDFRFSGGSLECKPNCDYNFSKCIDYSCDNNGTAELGEVCDTTDLRGFSCKDLDMFKGGLLKCDSLCMFDRSECSLVCNNNNIAELGETCDGSDIRQKTCEDFGRFGGYLTCSTSCKFDFAECGPSCLPDWSCTEWSTCSNMGENITRVCTDLNNCPVTDTSISISQSSSDDTINISGEVLPPLGFPASSFTVVSLLEESPVDSQGGYTAEVYKDGVTLVGAVPLGKAFGLMNTVVASGSKVQAAYKPSSSNLVKLNPNTTAVSLIFLNPLLMTNDPERAVKLLRVIESDANVSNLAGVIEVVFNESDPFETPELQTALKEATGSVINTLVKNPSLLTTYSKPPESKPCDLSVCEDKDNDTYCACTSAAVNCDCDDSNPAVHPGSAELCNGRDDNCDATTDESCPCTVDMNRSCGINEGLCREGIQRCVNGYWALCSGSDYIGPMPEVCNNALDEDCDGYADEDCTCIDNSTEACGTDIGECKKGMRTCFAGNWSACSGKTPLTEVCIGNKDEDCDSLVDCKDPDCSSSSFCATGATSSTSTCFDGKKNQGETNIDCGGPCPACENICGYGEIRNSCRCEGSLRTSGYCCDGKYQSDSCSQVCTDSDGDSLCDADEVSGGTDPNNMDTDSDNIYDNTDVSPLCNIDDKCDSVREYPESLANCPQDCTTKTEGLLGKSLGSLWWILPILFALILGLLVFYLLSKKKAIKKGNVESKVVVTKSLPKISAQPVVSQKKVRDVSSLVAYFDNSLKKGEPKLKLRESALKAGWTSDEINEAFSSLEKSKKETNKRFFSLFKK